MLKQCANAARSGKMILRFFSFILPRINREVDHWQDFARANMRGELQKQALASIAGKRFHCQGGAFYALFPGTDAARLIPLIAALQTISDYLDNLCDRASVLDAAAFAQLHFAMEDALNPAAAHRDYYAAYPFKEDGGYLDELVNTCQTALGALPAYPLVKDDLLRLARLYSHLQTYKHIDPAQRERAMLDWLEKENTDPALSHWEFAAATGSTLGMFMLAAAAAQPALQPETVRKIADAYFPWISGLHIQLDYFIDQSEDRQNLDLNFIFYYRDEQETAERLKLFYRQARARAGKTPHPFFAETIVCGLLALYLSDPKADPPEESRVRRTLLAVSGVRTKLLYALCRLLRRKRLL